MRDNVASVENSHSSDSSRADDNTRSAEMPVSQPHGDNLRQEYFDCLASGQSNCPRVGASPTSGSLESPDPFKTGQDQVFPRAQWTLAINLTTTVDHAVARPNSREQSGSESDSGEADPRVYAGARSKAAQLLALAEETRGKSVNLVVQNAEPISVRNQQMNLHTYIIRDGQINELPVRPSAGVAADTEALLATASRQAPADRVGLMSQSHGGGPHGISGDTGKASLEDLQTAIKNGLRGSGHDHLDILDFDACSMGNSRVLSAFSRLADKIVASPEEESTSGPHVDAQNEAAIVRTLLAHPEQNAAQLGHNIIDLANHGANGGEAAAATEDREPGTPSLSLYDGVQARRFADSVDAMGRALSENWSGTNGSANHQAIRQAIEATPFASTIDGPRMADSPTPEERDAKVFAENLVRAIDDHKLNDPSGKLRASAESVLAARQALVVDYHGEHKGGYDKQGGVSLFLPGETFLNNQARTDEINLGADFTNVANSGKLTRQDRRESALERIDMTMEEAVRAVGEGHAGDFAPITAGRAAIAAAQTQEQYTQAMADFALRGAAFQNTAAGRLLAEQARKQTEERMANVFNDELSPTTPGWDSFLQSLYHAAPEAYHH